MSKEITLKNKITLGYWSVMSALFSMITFFLITSGILMAILVFTDIESKAALTNLYLVFLACSMLPNILLPVVSIMLGCITVQTRTQLANGEINNRFMIFETLSITALLILEIVAFYVFGTAIDIILGLAFIAWIVLNIMFGNKHEKKLDTGGLIWPIIGAVFGIIFTLCLFIPMI